MKVLNIIGTKVTPLEFFYCGFNIGLVVGDLDFEFSPRQIVLNYFN